MPVCSFSLLILPVLRLLSELLLSNLISELDLLPRLLLRFILEFRAAFGKQYFAVGGRRYVLDSAQVYIGTGISIRNQLCFTANTNRDLSVLI